jgi:hypothetical protein
MRPITVFEQNFRTATSLLMLYDLLQCNEGEVVAGEVVEAVRRVHGARQDEQYVVIKNDRCVLGFGEAANIPRGFFREPSQAFLLRQSIVAACSAVDVYFADRIEENLLRVFLATRPKPPKRLLDLRFSLEEILSVEGYDPPLLRLKQILLSQFERKTFASSQQIEEAVSVLGVDDFWVKVASRVGMDRRELRRQIDELVSRRNDVIHRADRPRPKYDKTETGRAEEDQEVRKEWVGQHIACAHNVVIAADGLIEEYMNQFPEASGVKGLLDVNPEGAGEPGNA